MRVRKKLGVCYVLMVLLTIAIVIPIIWLVFISMKPNSEIMNNPLSLPNALDFGNYVSALQTLDLFTLYKNTAFIAVCSLAVEIVITFSSAVMCGNRLKFWNTIPTERLISRAWESRSVMVMPPSLMLPS